MKLKHAIFCLLVWICPTAVLAEIDDAKHIKIDFTNADDAAAKATWSNPDRLTISKDGLGWDGDSAAEFDGWIQTKPLALGLSWRPPYAIQANVAVEPPPQEFKLGNGQSSTPDAGDAYVRYSPDRVHWSNWQVLQRGQNNPAVEKQKPHGAVTVAKFGCRIANVKNIPNCLRIIQHLMCLGRAMRKLPPSGLSNTTLIFSPNICRSLATLNSCSRQVSMAASALLR